ncbi:SAM-dependent methyltransferase, partial [Streptomyces sp. NPDC127574]
MTGEGNGRTHAVRWTDMRIEKRQGYEGTGPGAITPDGCAVEL